jgi:hypothetical protein
MNLIAISLTESVTMTALMSVKAYVTHFRAHIHVQVARHITVFSLPRYSLTLMTKLLQSKDLCLYNYLLQILSNASNSVVNAVRKFVNFRCLFTTACILYVTTMLKNS